MGGGTCNTSWTCGVPASAPQRSASPQLVHQPRADARRVARVGRLARSAGDGAPRAIGRGGHGPVK
eukprot:7379424-Prymnesium_polylepis.1